MQTLWPARAGGASAATIMAATTNNKTMRFTTRYLLISIGGTRHPPRSYVTLLTMTGVGGKCNGPYKNIGCGVGGSERKNPFADRRHPPVCGALRLAVAFLAS